MATVAKKEIEKVPEHPKEISTMVRSLSSNLASIISVTCCFPLEVLKTRMQIQVSQILKSLDQAGLESLFD